MINQQEKLENNLDQQILNKNEEIKKERRKTIEFE